MNECKNASPLSQLSPLIPGNAMRCETSAEVGQPKPHFHSEHTGVDSGMFWVIGLFVAMMVMWAFVDWVVDGVKRIDR